MPTDLQHMTHGNHNIDFLSHIYPTQFNDWIITVAFYSSLHVFEYAIFKTKDLPYRGKKLQVMHSKEFFPAIRTAGLPLPHNCTSKSSDHTARKQIVNRIFPEVSGAYYRLSNDSHTARYELYQQGRPKAEDRIRKDLVKIITWSNTRYPTVFKQPTLA
ncbi:MAG: hypothetical protein WCK61_01295 [Candidatus Omnitrophota bacterium]